MHTQEQLSIENKQWLDIAFEKVTKDIEKLDRVGMMERRRAVFRYLLQAYGTWVESGDCLPDAVQLGYHGPILTLKVVKNA